jgi:hypothetical protein
MPGSTVGKAAASGIFLMAVGEAFNVYGALNSSPWTAENFGADPEKAASCRKYVLRADIANIALGIGAALVAESPAPLLGILAITVYMHAMYESALRKGQRAGSTSWLNVPADAEAAAANTAAAVNRFRTA